MIKYTEVDKGLYILDEDYSEGGISIPKGFKWNGCSVPWWLRWLIRLTDKTKEASLVHDVLYAAGSKVARIEADRLFLRKLLEDNVAVLKATIMYYAVRVFGSLFFKC